jgi:hypothetical protein
MADEFADAGARVENDTVGRADRTSAVTLISSEHGRDRRLLRSITKRDLQAAVKYGVKEKGWPCPQTQAPRWKYTHGHVVYITDETSKREVTSYVLPIHIDLVAIPASVARIHEEIARTLRAKPQLCTSHSVLVVDQSKSMSTSDVVDFRSRSGAAFGTLSL